MRVEESVLEGLNKRFRTAAESAFRGKLSDLKLSGTAITVKQLRILLNEEDRLPPSPLEIQGIPLDRPLLHYSPIYRRSRQLALKLGIEYTPDFLSRGRTLERFDSTLEKISYLPFSAELRWALEKRRPLADVQRLIEIGKQFSAPTLHESNHAVLFRLLRCRAERMTAEKIRDYFYLVEALVLLLDIRFAIEIGCMGPVVERIGLAYRSIKTTHFSRADPFSFDAFMSFVDYTMAACRNPRITLEAAQKDRESRSLPFVRLPLMDTSRGFLGKTNRTWTANYLLRHRNRLVLPPAPKSPRPYVLNLSDFRSPNRSEEAMFGLHKWFVQTYVRK